MPFVEFSHVEKLLPEGLRGALRSQPSTFTQLEEIAAIIVRDATGRPIPETVEEPMTAATDWAVLPMAWLIAHAALTVWEPPDEVRRTVEANRAHALAILADHRVAPTATSGLASITPIQGELSW